MQVERPRLKKVSKNPSPSTKTTRNEIERPKLRSTGKLANLDSRGSVQESKSVSKSAKPKKFPTLRKSECSVNNKTPAPHSSSVNVPSLRKVNRDTFSSKNEEKPEDHKDLIQAIKFGGGNGGVNTSGKKVDDKFIQELCRDLTNVKHIDMSNSGLNENQQLKVLASAIKSNSVETVVLDGNASISKKNCDGLGSIIAMSRSLTAVNAGFAKNPPGMEKVLKRNRVVNGYVTTIQQARGVVKSISPRDNELVTRILQVIYNRPSMTELIIDKEIRFQHLSKTMVLDLAEAMKYNFYLKKMKIMNVELGNAFLTCLASSLEVNFCLEVLDLRGNSITSEAMVDFCKAMTQNTTLRKVNLTKMHSPVLTHDESTVLQALSANSTLTEFRIEFRNPANQTNLEKVLAGNKSKKLSSDEFDENVLAFLKRESAIAEQIIAERKTEQVDESELATDDWGYLYELSQLADVYNALDNAYEEESEAISQQDLSKAPKKSKMSMSELKQTMDIMSADGSFLTEEFISKYIVENKDSGAVVFEFTNQFKMFKRFQIGDKARAAIVRKFVDVLLAHPRSAEFTHLHMSNINCSDDLLERLSNRCTSNPDLLPKLHLINLETNNICGSGVVELANCLKTGKSLRYLQTIKLENQTSLMKTEAEESLAKSLLVNKSVIRCGLRVRNLLERDRIGRYLQRNMDYLRRARRQHAALTGQVLERSRNKMEQFIDRIAANDPSITEVEIVGDPNFLGLNSAEVLNAGKSFSGNSNVKRVKMCNLNLDDKFAIEFGRCLPSCKVEYLCMDSNAISGEGILALVEGLATNGTVTEFQIRHQRKNMAAADEERVADLLGSNKTVVKMGVDFRSHSARTKLERKIADNVTTQRKARAGVRKNSAPTASSAGKIRSDEVQKLFQAIAKNDSGATKLELDQNPEFLQMEKRQKEHFYGSLKTNKTVETLLLHNLQLDNGFADMLASSLLVNKTLRHISLDKNDFTSPGVLTIAMAACQRKNIKSLSIMNPRFKLTNEHAEEFLAAMEKKSYLTKCNIQFREESQKKRLAKVLAKNK